MTTTTDEKCPLYLLGIAGMALGNWGPEPELAGCMHTAVEYALKVIDDQQEQIDRQQERLGQLTLAVRDLSHATGIPMSRWGMTDWEDDAASDQTHFFSGETRGD